VLDFLSLNFQLWLQWVSAEKEMTKECLPSSIIKPYNEREIRKNKQKQNPWRKSSSELMEEVTRFIPPDVY